MKLLPWWAVVAAIVGALVGSEVVRRDTQRALDECASQLVKCQEEVCK